MPDEHAASGDSPGQPVRVGLSALSNLVFRVAAVAQTVGEVANARLAAHALASVASAPVKAFDQKGESPFQARRYQPVVENGNCVSVRKGGEQPETNDQSVTKVNSIRPSLSGRILAIPEPLTVRRANPSILWISQGDRHGKPRRCSNGTKRSGRNGSMVVGDGMVRRSNEISREICQISGSGRRTATKQWGTLLNSMAQAHPGVSSWERERTSRYRDRRWMRSGQKSEHP